VHGLGERIALRCAELGITYLEISHRLGYPRDTGCHIVRFSTQKSVKYERLVQLAKALEWDSLAPLFERIPTFEGQTRVALRKLEKNIAAASPGARELKPTERGRK
jgi:transcriptional regulator with XRE-family HTH domain